jgi:F-type H+-transporting ATPase subunit delta
MLIKKVNRRYAKALLDFAMDANLVDQIHEDVVKIKGIIADSPELKSVLKSPVIMPKQKEGVVDKVFTGHLSEPAINFLKVVIRRGREGVLEETMFSFIEQYRELKGIRVATVTSAVALSDEQMKDIQERLVKRSKLRVDMVQVVDPSVMGGVKVQMGDLMFDATVSKQLESLKRSLEENIFVPKF